MLKVLKRKRLIVGLIVVAVCCAVVFGVLTRGGTTETDHNGTYEVKLSQAIIDEAISICADSENWGIALPDIRVNYVAGVGIEAAIVLHNGNDAERVVTLEYAPIKSPQMDGDTGEYYDPAPEGTEGWVSIDVSTVRLVEMETKVVPIHLLVPAGTDIPMERWEFRIAATGIVVREYAMELIVTTVDNDDTLIVTLALPLLQDDVASVLSVVSSVDEIPQVARYDAGTRELTITGLVDNSVRGMTIVYEYGELIRTAYNQRWLIKML